MNLDRAQVRRVLVTGLLAFAAYSTWAFFVNWSYGWGHGVRAALVQGGFSFFATLVMTAAMEKVFASFHPGVVRFLATAVGPGSVALAVVVASHWLNGTPELAVTVAPSILLGIAYAWGYTAYLSSVAPGRG